MTGAVILFVLFIIVYILISDVFTILFRLTGMTEEKARFQVVSLLTNSGFTTQESEIIVNSKIRRRLAKLIMMFGYAFTVTIVSSVVNIFLTLNEAEQRDLLLPAFLSITVLAGFMLLRRVPFIKMKFDLLIERLGNRLMFGQHSNPIILLDDYGSMVVAQIILNNMPNILSETPLSKSGIKEKHGILIMMIKSDDGKAHHADGSTVLKPQDIIVVLGDKRHIRKLFEVM